MADTDYEVISASEYEKRTRGRSRGRRSKYSDLGKEAGSLKGGQVIAISGTKNQVVSLRNYFKRNHGDDFQVRSVAGDDGAYQIYVMRASE